MPLEPLIVIPALWEACSITYFFDCISLTVANDPTIIENPYLVVLVQVNMDDLCTQDYQCNAGLIAVVSTQGYQIWQHQHRVTCLAQPIHIHTCK